MNFSPYPRSREAIRRRELEEQANMARARADVQEHQAALGKKPSRSVAFTVKTASGANYTICTPAIAHGAEIVEPKILRGKRKVIVAITYKQAAAEESDE
jgi:thioredoxin reductase